MIRRRAAQRSFADLMLFGSGLPPLEQLLDPILRRIDGLLDDEALVDQVMDVLRQRYPQSSRRGRHGTPAEVTLRLLVLKHLKNWSYEQLQWEVTGSVAYRYFCRIDTGKVPDAKTMVRLGQLLEGPALQTLFERVVAMAVEKKVSRGRRMRVDTTVVEAPIHHPSDSRLCEDTVRVVNRSVQRLQGAGVRLPFRFRRIKTALGRRMREIGRAQRLKGDRMKEALKKPYRGLLRLTGRVLRQASKALDAARRTMRWARGAKRRAIAREIAALETMIPRGRAVIRQTRARVFRGVTNRKDKLVSIFEPYAQVLRRGKAQRPTEFGLLVKVQEADGGIVTDVSVAVEKADAPLLVPSVEHHCAVFGQVPELVATDRGFYSDAGVRALEEFGVGCVAVPKPGYRSRERIEHERQRPFRRGRAWRSGGEARISRLKNHFGMGRSRYRGDKGLMRTAHWAGIANNLVAIATA